MEKKPFLKNQNNKPKLVLETDNSILGYREEVDWWSLGCIFWEMILGVPPITGDTPDEIFEATRNWASIIPQLLDEYKMYMTPDCFSLLSGFVIHFVNHFDSFSPPLF